MIFLDTNVLVYASGLNGEGDARTHIARTILDLDEDFALSVQVIHEFYDKATRRQRTVGLPEHIIHEFISRWRAFEVQPMTLEVFDAAVAIRKRYEYRYYDCAIIAAAQMLGCDTLYSEDMQHGQRIGDLTIIDPFR